MALDSAGLLPLITPDSPGLDITANQSPRIIGVSVTLIVIATVAVVLRFVSRLVSKAGLWWDDWMIVAALVVSWGACILMIISTNFGFGQHMDAEGSLENRLNAAMHWFKLFYIYETIYTVAIALTKYSILLFYSRIFKEHYFKVALWATCGLVTAWFIAIEISVIVECQPIHALWDFSPGHCINLQQFFLGSGIPNILLNTIILILPLPMIWTLQIHVSHKLALSSVFLLGGFIVVVSIVRVVILNSLQQVDITWEFVDAGIWTSVEPAIGVCSACLPIMRSLWIRSKHSSPSDAGSRSPRTSSKRSTRSFHSLPLPDHKATSAAGPVEKEARVGSFTSHTPLNELSADGELPWGNHVSIYSTSRTSDNENDYIAMDDLPIQRDGDEDDGGRARAGLGSELPAGNGTAAKAKGLGLGMGAASVSTFWKTHRKNRSSVAELYGSSV
ncbi:hypothetical protein MMC19_002762 [Ptychographa xylographoides]|nr:hypothetical protein [Ptychographa xylographoides]